MRTEEDATHAIEEYADMVKRICFLYLKNQQDTQDIFQNVFLKYILSSHAFDSENHKKAWLIRVTLNECKDFLKSFHRKNISLDTIGESLPAYTEDDYGLLEVVLTLPAKYKDVIYLFYYENYTAVEIAVLLHKNENTIYTWLSRAKKMLKEKLGGDGFE